MSVFSVNMLIVDGDTLLWAVLYINNDILYIYMSNIGRTFNDKNDEQHASVRQTTRGFFPNSTSPILQHNKSSKGKRMNSKVSITRRHSKGVLL